MTSPHDKMMAALKRPVISAKMREALVKAAAHSSKGELRRWPGGFWTYPGCEARKAWGNHYAEAPVWWVSTHTIKALLDRGLLDGSSYPGPVSLTEQGWKLAIAACCNERESHA